MCSAWLNQLVIAGMIEEWIVVIVRFVEVRANTLVLAPLPVKGI